jgi:hypothetical protein
VKRRRIEITVETEQVIILRQRGAEVTGWCPVCAERVPMFTAAEANVLAEIAADAQLHFTEMPDGTLRLCLNSLLNSNLINKGD